MSRLAATFAELAQTNRKALIPFVTAGDPNPGFTVPLMHAMVGAGVDIICLLYTSPSPRDAHESRMPSSA